MTETTHTPAKGPTKTTVAILYNGAEREFRLHDEQTVEHLLKEAIRNFGIADNQHLLSLFNAGGAELPDSETLRVAGVKTGDHLVLRPGVVKGG
ncbi:MAG TPA: EsaB/YukD family protein [Solirubrobacterales bacterium]|nr:EsaB/YukD family protein [Solirubrobacterales bacterium]